jgi:hypothetical protein
MSVDLSRVKDREGLASRREPYRSILEVKCTNECRGALVMNNAKRGISNHPDYVKFDNIVDLNWIKSKSKT